MRLLRPVVSGATFVGITFLLAGQGSSLVVVAQGSGVPASSDGPLPTLTGGGIMSSLFSYVAPPAASSPSHDHTQDKKDSSSSRWSFLEWRRRSSASKKRTPWFIPAEWMREGALVAEDQEEEEGVVAATPATGSKQDQEEEENASSLVSFSMMEEEIVEEEEMVTSTSFGSSLEDLSNDNADLLMEAEEAMEEAMADQLLQEEEEQQEEEEEQEEEEQQAPAPPPPPPVPRASFLKARVKAAIKRSTTTDDDDDSIPNGRSLSSALSVIGGGLPLKRGGSDAASLTISAMTTIHTSSKKTTTTTTTTNKEEGHSEVQVIQQEEAVAVETTASTNSPSSAAAAALSQVEVDAARDAELARRFHAETGRQVAALSPEQKSGLDRVREALYGPNVDPKRIAAVDQLVVCDDREAMMLAFLSRKNFDVDLALRSFDRVIAWRLENDIENVFHETRLPREKIEKHRECWPTAFYYTHDHAGDPVFVDRMGILELAQLRKGPVALDLQDMVAYYIQTMEGRRRLLFPHLSRKSGRLVTSYVSVVDVSHFGPQHFGRQALQFMRSLGDVHDENYSDLCKSLYIINAPFFFHKVFHLISCMMSQELKDRLKVLNKKQSLIELSKIMPADVAQAIVEGDHQRERAEERQLHEFLDAAAKAGHHKRRWIV